MRKINFNNYLQELPTLLKEHNETVIVYSDKTVILQGNNNYNSIEDITAYKTHNFGGTIVNFAGDICVGNYQLNYYNFGSNFMKNFADFLKGKQLNASVVGNDILIDGLYKVASYMSQNIKGVIYTAIHISINMDLDLIKKVCVKEINKIPKGLSEYGITTEQVVDWVSRYKEV